MKRDQRVPPQQGRVLSDKAARRRASILDPQRRLEIVHGQWWQMLEESHHPIFLVDADSGRVLEANARFSALLGWPRERARGMPISLLVAEEDWDRVAELADTVLGEGVGRLEKVSLRHSADELLQCDLEGRLALFHDREAVQFAIETGTEGEFMGMSDRAATFFRDLSQILPLLLDFDQILDRIVERFAQAIEFHAFALSMVEKGELKRLTLYCAEEPPEGFLTEVQERVMEALLKLGVQVTPTNLQYSIRERPWIHPGFSRAVGSELILPIPMGGAQGVQGLGGVFHQRPQAFRSEETALFSTFVGGIASSYLIYHSYREIEAQSYTDPLTGLANRRRLFKELEQLVESSREEDRFLSLLLIDIDHFKRLNDLYGHKVGDEVLRQLADFFRRGVRDTDLVTRYGGEEFLILLPRTDIKVAAEIGERIRSEVESMEIRIPPEPLPGVPSGGIRLTISLGVGSVRPGEDPDSAIRRVDEAMYRAKEGGRNRVALETF
jgi:diguanylate cyclase (GGDEF)-like protein